MHHMTYSLPLLSLYSLPPFLPYKCYPGCLSLFLPSPNSLFCIKPWLSFLTSLKISFFSLLYSNSIFRLLPSLCGAVVSTPSYESACRGSNLFGLLFFFIFPCHWYIPLFCLSLSSPLFYVIHSPFSPSHYFALPFSILFVTDSPVAIFFFSLHHACLYPLPLFSSASLVYFSFVLTIM